MTYYSRLQASNILNARLDSLLDKEQVNTCYLDNDAIQVAISYIAINGDNGVNSAVRYVIPFSML